MNRLAPRRRGPLRGLSRNHRMAAAGAKANTDFVNNAVLGPLKSKRTATIDRISTAISRAGAKADNLTSLATCTAQKAGNNNGGANNGGNNGGNSDDPNNLGILA